MRTSKSLALLCSSFVPALAVTVTLQQGLNGYNGCIDVELRNPTINYNEKGPYPDRFWVIEF